MIAAVQRQRGARWPLAKVTLLLAFAISKTYATQQYCASLNTGADTSPIFDKYQSNGACTQTCKGYAFGVVQYKNCWCSNYAPGDTTSVSDCGVGCPGYPFEKCGNAGSGLYGYIALGPAPSGTQGASSSSPTPQETTTQPTEAVSPSVSTESSSENAQGFLSTKAPVVPSASSTSVHETPSPPIIAISSFPPIISFSTSFLTQSTQNSPTDPSPEAVTVLDTSVQVSYVPITPSTTSTSSASSTPTYTTPTIVPISLDLNPSTSTTTAVRTTLATSQTSSSSTSSTWTPTPYTSVMTVTGQVKTLTVTPTAPTAAATTIAVEKAASGGFFSSSGKVAGTFVSVALVVVLIIAGIIFFLMRRRRRRAQEQAAQVRPNPTVAGSITPHRNPSRLSNTALLGESSNTQNPAPTQGAERSPADTLSSNRRNSYPHQLPPDQRPRTDQRLDPAALAQAWSPIHDNGSHASIQSLRDHIDYSRPVLSVANPDTVSRRRNWSEFQVELQEYPRRSENLRRIRSEVGIRREVGVRDAGPSIPSRSVRLRPTNLTEQSPDSEERGTTSAEDSPGSLHTSPETPAAEGRLIDPFEDFSEIFCISPETPAAEGRFTNPFEDSPESSHGPPETPAAEGRSVTLSEYSSESSNVSPLTIPLWMLPQSAEVLPISTEDSSLASGTPGPSTAAVELTMSEVKKGKRPEKRPSSFEDP